MAVDNLLPIQNAEATQTMYQLLKEPDGWYDHIRRYSTAVILASVFGLRGTSFDSPRVKALYHVQDQLTQITEIGATPPVDIFPWLKYLPDFMSGWRKWAFSIRAEHRAFWFALMRDSKKQMQKKGVKECFLARMVKDQEKSGLSDEHIAYLGGTLVSPHSLSDISDTNDSNRWKLALTRLLPLFYHSFWPWLSTLEHSKSARKK